MSSRDAIELSLGLPIPWEVFEDLVYNILVSDDLPSLRKLGGGNDWGLDAESMIYLGEGAASRIAVQVAENSTT
jgi:hypothetical protein